MATAGRHLLVEGRAHDVGLSAALRALGVDGVGELAHLLVGELIDVGVDGVLVGQEDVGEVLHPDHLGAAGRQAPVVLHEGVPAAVLVVGTGRGLHDAVGELHVPELPGRQHLGQVAGVLAVVVVPGIQLFGDGNVDVALAGGCGALARGGQVVSARRGGRRLRGATDEPCARRGRSCQAAAEEEVST